MTDRPAISVVVVSRERPEALRCCLVGLSQQFFDPFEVVVVADAAGRAALRTLPQARHVKLVEQDEANVSVARNLGIAAAAGEIVAFIDDDSVPEPTWLWYLSAPFVRPEVIAAGGPVRGRNGISWQSRTVWVDRSGVEHALNLTPNAITLLTGAPGRAIKTEGTNMAVRRSWLAETGGFDPRYRFFLDETDMNMRLAAEGAVTALVPMAEVHHGFAESRRRSPARVPRDLYEIGASWSVFLGKFCPEDARQARLDAILAEERRRLLGYMVQGGLEPRDIRRLLAGLRQGFAEGAARRPEPMPRLPHAGDPFRPFASQLPPGSRLFAGRVWSRRRLRRQAEAEVAAGRVATVFRFSHTMLYHKVTFRRPGYWLQTGGLFGRSERDQPLFRFTTFGRRVAQEADRVRTVRRLDD